MRPSSERFIWLCWDLGSALRLPSRKLPVHSPRQALGCPPHC
jgi:hypothetical protein